MTLFCPLSSANAERYDMRAERLFPSEASIEVVHDCLTTNVCGLPDIAPLTSGARQSAAPAYFYTFLNLAFYSKHNRPVSRRAA